MIRHTVAFRAVPAGKAAPAHRMVGLFSEPEDNRDHLTAILGQAMADHMLGLMRQGLVQGQYKEFNLLPGASAGSWVLFMGVGSRTENQKDYRLDDRLRSIVAIAARHFRRKGIASFAMDDLTRFGVAPARAGQLIAEGAVLGTYTYDVYRSKSKYAPTESIDVLCSGDVAEMQQVLDRARAVAESVCMARDLINRPSSDLRPLDFAAFATEMASEFNTLRVKVLGRDALLAERCGLHLGVARGSNAEPCLCIVEYTPPGLSTDAPWDVALVGKGVTFDTGGYDLKPSAGMRRMYRDMAGAAVMLGTIRSVAALQMPMRVVAVMPLAENMVNGEAFRPGDILTSRKGLTVEIANTDAEGRLLLADALTYACDLYRPRQLFDAATLTGAVRVALGLFVTGLMTHSQDDEVDEALANRFREAGRRTGEWVWRLPVDEDYKVQLGSRVADLANCSTDGNSGAGAITAAVFLKQFIDFSVVQGWGHLDIAATAFMERTVIYNKVPYVPREGATGIGVRLLIELLEQTAAGA